MATAEEEASVEVAVEETGVESSGEETGRDLEFWDESETTRRRATIYRVKNIRSDS
jgi:hypothetical protein